MLSVTQKNLAGRGGADPLVGAHEDGGAKLRLELAQELAQAGLRDVQPLSRCFALRQGRSDSIVRGDP